MIYAVPGLKYFSIKENIQEMYQQSWTRKYFFRLGHGLYGQIFGSLRICHADTRNEILALTAAFDSFCQPQDIFFMDLLNFIDFW